MPDPRIDWNAEIRRRYGREYGERLPVDRVSDILLAAQLERTSVSARYAGDDATRALELLFDDLKSIEEDYERAFLGTPQRDLTRQGVAERSEWFSSVTAPPRWAARTRLIMRRYHPLQTDMLAACGARDFVRPHELAALLGTLVAGDPAEGEVVTLELPPGLEETHVVGRLGVHMNPWLSALRYLADRRASEHPDRFPTFGAWLARQNEDLAQELTRIGKLSLVVRHIAKETGCEEWQALSYLLCGDVPELTWVRARRVTRPEVGETWVMEVGAPGVPANDVRRTYIEARAALAEGGENVRRQHSHAQSELYEFVRPLRERGVPWSQIRETWNAKPGVRPYDRTRTMEVAYLRARKRLKASTVEAD